MKKLIIVRHGDYDFKYQLNDTGRNQIKRLADKLYSQINTSSIIILSSIAARARQSAEIIVEKFKIDSFKEYDFLESLGGSLKDDQVTKTLDLIHSVEDKFDIVFLVIHYEFVESFPKIFGKKFLNTDFERHSIKIGNAWLIDCKNKTIEHITP